MYETAIIMTIVCILLAAIIIYLMKDYNNLVKDYNSFLRANDRLVHEIEDLKEARFNDLMEFATATAHFAILNEEKEAPHNCD